MHLECLCALMARRNRGGGKGNMERTINEALFAFPGYESLFVVILAGVTMYDVLIIYRLYLSS